MNSLRKFLFVIFLLSVTSMAIAWPSDSLRFKRIATQQNILIEGNSFVVNVDMQMPLFSEALQKYLSKTMFDNEEELLPSAVNDFFQKYSPENSLHNNNVRGLDLILTCVSFNPGKYVTLYMRFPQIKKFAHGDVSIIDKEMSIIYDIANQHILNHRDIFIPQYIDCYDTNTEDLSERRYSPAAEIVYKNIITGEETKMYDHFQFSSIENMNVDDPFRIHFTFELDQDFLTYQYDKLEWSSVSNKGKIGIVARIPLCVARDYFTPYFNRLIDWENVKKRADSLRLYESNWLKKEQELRRISDEEKKKISENLLQAYSNDKKKSKNRHLYFADNTYWISDYNKRITELNEDELLQLKLKDKPIYSEIEIIKESLLADSVYHLDVYPSFDFENEKGDDGFPKYVQSRLSLKSATNSHGD